MEENNNTILGFVSSAVDYLSAKIPEVAKELDITHENSLEDIKKELDKRISSVLDVDQDGELDIVTKGKEVFSDIKEKKNDLIGEFEEIFNVDFDNDKKDLEMQNHLLSLLKKKDDDFIEDEFDIIAKNASNNEEEIKEDVSINKITGGNEDNIDDIFSEIINNEDNEATEAKEEIDINEALLEEPVEKPIVIEEIVVEKPIAELKEEVENELEDNKLADIVSEAKKEIEEVKVEPIQHFKRPINSIKENEMVANLQDIIGEVKPVEIKVKEKTPSNSMFDAIYNPIFTAVDERPIEEIFIKNPGSGSMYDSSYEARMKDIYDSINDGDSIEVINIGNSDIASGEEADDDYIENLLDELNSKNILETIEKARQEEEEERNKVYNAVKEIYPYLDKTFIKSVYDMKGSIAYEYPENKQIIILHRLRFGELEGLRKFVEVMMGHDYLVNVDEKKMIVDVFKEYTNTDGLILANIFEIASQAKLLEGDYEGYRVILEGEEA